jgi:diguanylate cyclase (GGDEF)-like protein
MPNLDEPLPFGFSGEESFLELLAETLENLDRVPRGQFLQRFFKTMAQLELSDTASLDCWDQIIRRRRELSNHLDKPISLRTAIVEVLASSNHLRVPVLMEYDELKKLQINAATDPLTGLYNRRWFEEHFERELNRSVRYNEHLAVVMLDLHNFKEVNDRYGHQRGDALLKSVAATFRKSLRTSDYAFRIGGDEFALLLVQADTAQATTLATRVLTNFTAAGESLQMNANVSLDFGLAVCPEDGNQKELLVRMADERLYTMKNVQRDAGAVASAGASFTRTASAPVAPLVSAKLSSPAPRPPGAAIPLPASTGLEQRKWDRVQLAGTRAYAQLGTGGQTAQVLDLGYGGVALEFKSIEDLAAVFEAVLHVPILPPVRVNLRPLYQVVTATGSKRVGCAFVS